jgi:DNA-binding PadR family transcriptional regulator
VDESRLTQEDVLLLVAAGAIGPYKLDPIRIMKAAFLVSQRGRDAWKKLFSFRPYAYGPFDASVYGARDRLIAEGLLEQISGRYDSYQLTEEGRKRVHELQELLGNEDAEWFSRIGTYVTTRSFERLLREVYAAYPDFAARSVANV